MTAVLSFLAASPVRAAAEAAMVEDGPPSAPPSSAGGDAPPGAVLAPERVPGFVLAGNARFTIVSKVTGKRFTFRVQASRASDAERAAPTLFFVSVLTGSCNETAYTFLGTIFGRTRFVRGRKSSIGQDAPSAKAFAWFWTALSVRGVVPATCEVWHEGRCGKCGRALTDPASIEMGLGPKCGSSE